MPEVAIALGSNLGDRRGHLAWAVDALAARLADLRVSAVIETEPFGVPDEQPPYLNAAAVGETDVLPRVLLDFLLNLERRRGRDRPAWRAPRTLDLDLILYGDQIIDEPGLVVPHPHFRERPFVLAPLAEIAPAMRDPVSGQTIAELARQLRER
jgi:2-amino-4-hydroxy-6-hydroxymethyldihydropteridine diphosphokinase